MWFEAELMLRILLSGICGIIIGYERKSRGKGAGIRTHMIVALAASLMMIISKYGFTDLVGGADGSRIAAQIVSGVGFLGAGMIYVHKNSINGLTTAAGIWATSGIGMAMGAGMYTIAASTTMFIIVLQILMHRNTKSESADPEFTATFVIKNTPEALEYLHKLFEEKEWKVESFNLKHKDNTIIIKADIISPEGVNFAEASEIISKNDYILSLKF